MFSENGRLLPNRVFLECITDYSTALVYVIMIPWCLQYSYLHAHVCYWVNIICTQTAHKRVRAHTYIYALMTAHECMHAHTHAQTQTTYTNGMLNKICIYIRQFAIPTAIIYSFMSLCACVVGLQLDACAILRRDCSENAQARSMVLLYNTIRIIIDRPTCLANFVIKLY